MPHVLHTIWIDSREPTNPDTLWIKPIKEGAYAIYVYGVKGWTMITAEFKGTIGELIVSQLPEATPESNGVMSAEDKAKLDALGIYYGSTEYWEEQKYFIPPAGTIVVYTDYETVMINDKATTFPGIKIGSGNAYVQELAFVNGGLREDLLKHINEAVSAFVTTDNLNTALAEKQNNISDLSEIREGAAAGKTAYQKPSDGIPSTDMTEAVRTSLAKADSALQEHQRLKTINNESIVGDGNIVIPTVPTNVVKYTEQELTEAQQEQARDNIGAAATSGYYPDLHVGEADYLPGTETDEVEGILTVAKSTGLARIKEVKGKSLVWNQQVNPQTSGSETKQGITCVRNNGLFTMNGTRDGTGNASFLILPIDGELKFISGHKYLLKGCYPGGSDTTYGIWLQSSTAFPVGNRLVDTGAGIIRTALADETLGQGYFFIQMQGSSTFTFTNAVFAPQIHDLTQLFGSGNEPSTVAEFESWLANNIGYRDYYAYNPGEIISNNTEKLEITGLNQLNLEGRTKEQPSNLTPSSDFSFLTEEYVLKGFATNGYVNSNYIAEYSLSANRLYVKTSTIGASPSYGLGIPVKVQRNTTYCIRFTQQLSSSTVGVVGFNERGEVLSSLGTKLQSGATFNTGDAVMIAIDFKPGAVNTAATWTDICLSISGSRNGEYGPYQKSELELNLAAITGKLNGEGESVTIFPDGMRSAGTAYDSLIVDEDGWCRRAVISYHKIILTGKEIYNIATDNYIKSDATDAFIEYDQIPTTTAATRNRIICTHLVGATHVIWNNVGYPDEITLNATGASHQIHLNISNNRTGIVPGTDTKATAKTKIAAYIAAQYAAGTPVTIVVWRNPLEYVLDTPIYMGIKTQQGGVIRQLPENGAAPTTAPMRMDISYALSPEALVSGESLKNLLEALKAAGKIASYTMTYNATSGKWEFSIS